MPVYQYIAFNRKGKKVKGIITADGPVSARMRLSQESIYPLELKELSRVEKSKRRSWGISIFQRIDPQEITTALRQLSTLVSSGLPLIDCLNGLIEQIENQRLKTIFTQIREKVVEGNSLSQAISYHPHIFGEIYVNMIRAGENSGALDIILERLADFSERRMKLKRRIESSLAYPLFLIFISTVIVIFLMSFVMPKVISIFEGMKLALPLSTRILIFFTHFMRSYWPLVILGIILAISIPYIYIRTEKGRVLWDTLRLKIPLLGKLHQKASIARFTRTLSLLLQSGIPLVDALEISRHSAGNRIIERGIEEVIRQVGEGKDLATPLKNTGRFPPVVIQLIRAGEQSGELEKMLSKAADLYEDEVDTTVQYLTRVLEPGVILFMGVVVGFIVMAILLPIFDISGGIK